MNDRLLPPRGAAVAPVALRTALLVGGLSLAAAVLFWWPLLTGGALSGHDWSSHHFHYFDWVRISLRRYATLPLYMPDAVMTPNFLANAESPVLSPFDSAAAGSRDGHLPEAADRALQRGGARGRLPACCGISRFRRRSRRWPRSSSASAASCRRTWPSGTPGRSARSCCRRSCVSIGAPRSVALQRSGSRPLLGASVIIDGQHQPFIWQGLFLAGFAALWAAHARAAFPIVRLAWLFAATAGLAAPKLLPMLAEFADYAPTARIPGLPLGLLFTTLAARGQQPDFAPAGLAFTHGAGWWEYAFYVGPFALVCMAVGIAAARSGWSLLRARRAVPVALARGAAALPRSLGAAARAARLAHAARAVALSRARALRVLRGRGARARDGSSSGRRCRSRRLAVAVCLGLALLVAVDLHVESRAWQRAALGPPIAERDHRPLPLAFGSPAGARVELVEFSAQPARVSRCARRRRRRSRSPCAGGRRASNGSSTAGSRAIASAGSPSTYRPETTGSR